MACGGCGPKKTLSNENPDGLTLDELEERLEDKAIMAWNKRA